MEVLIEHFDEIVDSFQVGKIIFLHIDTDAEIQASVSPGKSLLTQYLGAQYNQQKTTRVFAS